jgi:heat shock protein HslJ
MKKIFYCLLLFWAISSCKSSQQTSRRQVINKYVPSTLVEDAMLQEGIDFFAEGNNPSNWTLQMNIDDTVRFEAEDGLSLKFAYNQLKKENNKERIIYTTKIKAGDVSILVKEADCTLQSKKNIQSKQVSFTFNSIVYNGCGKFLTNNKLQAKWVLEKIGNTIININEYNRIPIFEINIEKSTLLGNDGCNTIKGKFEVQGNRIQFYTIDGTNTACTKKSLSKIIQQQINNALVDYYFKEGKLYLYLSDDNLLVFTKK